MKHAMDFSASTRVRSPTATEDGVRWPELYALLSSAAVQNVLVPSGFGNLVACAISACHQKHVGWHHVSVVMYCNVLRDIRYACKMLGCTMSCLHMAKALMCFKHHLANNCEAGCLHLCARGRTCMWCRTAVPGSFTAMAAISGGAGSSEV